MQLLKMGMCNAYVAQIKDDQLFVQDICRHQDAARKKGHVLQHSQLAASVHSVQATSGAHIGSQNGESSRAALHTAATMTTLKAKNFSKRSRM